MAPQTQAPQKMEFAIRPYRADNPADENALIALINTCYRTRESWTNETNFVSGQRVNAKQMRQHAKEMPIFVAEEVTDGEAQVVACIKTGLTSHTEVTKLNNPAGYVALFAVHPRVQRRGLGRKLMLHAESFCRTLGADEMVSQQSHPFQIDNAPVHTEAFVVFIQSVFPRFL